MRDMLHHFSFLAQIFVLTTFWVRRMPRRPNFWLRVLLCGLILSASVVTMAMVRLFLDGDSWILFSYPYLVMLVLLGVCLGICFDAPLDLILLTHLLPSTAQLCASAVGDILYYITDAVLGIYPYDLISTLLICLVCFWLGRLYDDLNFYDRDIYRIINAASYCVVSCVFLLNAFTPQIEDRFVRYVLVAGYRFLMSAFVYFLIFSLLTVGRIRYQRNMTDVLLKKQEQQYALARDLTELVNIKYHDMKHMQGAPAKSSLQAPDTPGLNRYECIVRSGNAALDTVLTEKSIVCQRHRIDFTMMVDGARLSFMRPVDLYALFGNMLDNAIDCLVELPVADRHLRLRVSAVGSMVSVLCENVCRRTLQFADGLPQTTQADDRNHGFGTKSIARICEKYDAVLRMTLEEELFAVKILIPGQGDVPSQPT